MSSVHPKRTFKTLVRVAERLRIQVCMLLEVAVFSGRRPEAKDIDSISSSSVCRAKGAARVRSTVVSF